MLVVTVLCIKQDLANSWVMKEGNELQGTEHFRLLHNCIGYQMISADKLDDHAM